jgi:hypothetical protein
LVSIEPHTEKGRVQLRFTAHATSDEAKQQLLRALEKSPVFSDVRESQENPDDKGSGVQLALTATYTRA